MGVRSRPNRKGNEYITKPHDRQLLLRVVKKLLDHGHRHDRTDDGGDAE